MSLEAETYENWAPVVVLANNVYKFDTDCSHIHGMAPILRFLAHFPIFPHFPPFFPIFPFFRGAVAFLSLVFGGAALAENQPR